MSKLLKVILSIISIILALVLVYESVFFVMKKLYPNKYEDIVTTEAAANDLNVDLLYAVIKCESNFDQYAQSDAGAVGLMQLMPNTFTHLQKALDGEVKYDENKLSSPEINIHYGAYYLKTLLDKYDGNEKLALCAYNAGMGNVDGWLDDEKYSSNGEELDSIPYQETESYVSHVIKTKNIYYKLYN